MDDFASLARQIDYWQNEAKLQRRDEQDPRVSGYWHGKFNAYQDVLEEIKRLLERQKIQL